FIVLARAKGVKESSVYSRHIFRNSILPIAAFFGYEIVALLGGSIFIEMIYSYPGMGRLFLDSISTRDFSVANILILFYGFMAIVGEPLSDINLSIDDPRIRIKEGGWKMDNKDNNGRPGRQQEEENSEMMSVQERRRRREELDDRETAIDGRPRSGDPFDAR